MKKAVIIHGYIKKEKFYNTDESSSNMHWIPWLQNKLLQQNILTQTPELYQPFNPDYLIHKQQLDDFNIDEDTIVIAHSYGGGLVTKWLTETGKKVQKLILVAPWFDIDRKRGDLLKFKFNPDLSSQTKQGVYILESSDDMEAIKKSADFLRRSFPSANFYEFEKYGHFTLNSMKTREFPELLEICLSEDN